MVFNYAVVYKDKFVTAKFEDKIKYNDRFYYMFKETTMVWNKIYKVDIWKELRFPEGLIHEDNYINPYIVMKANNIVRNNKVYYFYNKTNDSSIMSNINYKSYYIWWICKVQKVNVTKNKDLYLYKYALRDAFRTAFKEYHSNMVFNFLTNEEKRTIESFFIEYKDEVKYLKFEEKLYLWSFFHGKVLNFIKAIEYYFKWRNPKNNIV